MAIPCRSVATAGLSARSGFSAEKDPAKLPFGGIDVALECTGHFTKHHDAAQLIAAGARKVLVSAPCRRS